jgi:hypothetical protein
LTIAPERSPIRACDSIQASDNFSDIGTIHSIMESYGQGSKQLWLTEWGWQAGEVGNTNQATYISQALNLIATTYNYVRLSATGRTDVRGPTRLKLAGLAAVVPRTTASADRWTNVGPNIVSPSAHW